jgi:hypothetical protein
VSASAWLPILLNQPSPEYATGNDDIEDAVEKTAFWGSQLQIKATGRGLVGKLKEGVGGPPAMISSKARELSINSRELFRTQPGQLLMLSPTPFTSSIDSFAFTGSTLTFFIKPTIKRQVNNSNVSMKLRYECRVHRTVRLCCSGLG